MTEATLDMAREELWRPENKAKSTFPVSPTLYQVELKQQVSSVTHIICEPYFAGYWQFLLSLKTFGIKCEKTHLTRCLQCGSLMLREDKEPFSSSNWRSSL